MKCALCGKSFDFEGKVSRKETCPSCGGDLKCCKQCRFYEPNAYNECREVNAERVVDKERANFCEYYVSKDPSQKNMNRTKGARKALEDLFTKK